MQIVHKKNSLYYLAFPMVSKTTPETFATGETVTDTAYYKDGGGAWTSLAITDTVAEIGTTGMYEIDLTAAELNHDMVIVKMTSTNAADTAFLFRLNANGIDDLATQTSVNIIDDFLDTEIAAILADTNELQTDWANGGRLDLLLDAILVDTGTDGVVISSATANQLADALLNRDMSAVSDTNARTPLNALRFLRNKYSISGTTLTIYAEDDTTAKWTSTVTTNASADPITGSDPA